MAHPADPNEPRVVPNKTKFEKEPVGHEGTMGGQRPLGVPAGIQSTKRGGVLVEEGEGAARENQDDKR